MTGTVLDWLRGLVRNVAPFVTLILLVGFFTVASGSFATLGNLENILTQISVTGIIAVGLTFVILCPKSICRWPASPMRRVSSWRISHCRTQAFRSRTFRCRVGRR